jgi:hypothetical protein
LRTATPISIADAAEAIGKHPRWLKRLLLRKEREIGQKIMIRVGDGEKRVTYRISLSALREVEPSLFDEATETEVQMREALDGFSERLGALEETVAQMQEMFGELTQTVRNAVRKYGQAVDAMRTQSVLGKTRC